MGHELGLSWQETRTPLHIVQYLCACGVKFSVRLSTCVSKASNAHTYCTILARTIRASDHKGKFPTKLQSQTNATSQHHVLPGNVLTSNLQS